jgi:uncharacterized membrane protein YidH (DUF202 family)
MLRRVGIVLLVVGLIGLAFGTFQYTRQKKVLDAGPIHIERTATETVTIPPLVAGGVAALGLVLTVVGSRKKAGG